MKTNKNNNLLKIIVSVSIALLIVFGSLNFLASQTVNVIKFRLQCINNNAVICDSKTLNSYGEDGTLRLIWDDLTVSEKRNIGITLHNYLISNVFYTNYITTPGLCVPNSIIRVLRFASPDKSVEDCQYINGHSETLSLYYSNSYSLPAYPASINSVHNIAALQIGPDVNNFNNWLFFQYGDSNIIPGSGQMHLPTTVIINKMSHVDCDGYITNGYSFFKNIASWYIDNEGLITNN